MCRAGFLPWELGMVLCFLGHDLELGASKRQEFYFPARKQRAGAAELVSAAAMAWPRKS